MESQTKSDKTREKILQTANRLFNERGAYRVHTHHIAKAAGLSPGNLYYHFKNKEDIILALFQQMELFAPGSWTKEVGEDPQAFSGFVGFFFSQLCKYRFFFRELLPLLETDPRLAACWKKAFRVLSSVMEKAALRWVKHRMMHSFSSKREMHAFIDNAWTVALFSSAYLESSSTPSGKEMEKKSIQHFVCFLMPYHTKEGKRVLQEMALAFLRRI